MSVIIKTDNLTKIYGAQRAVDSLNMNVHKGEIYGFLGRNNCPLSPSITPPGLALGYLRLYNALLQESL